MDDSRLVSKVNVDSRRLQLPKRSDPMKLLVPGLLLLGTLTIGCSVLSPAPAGVTVVVVTATAAPATPLAPTSTLIPRITLTPTSPTGPVSPSPAAPMPRVPTPIRIAPTPAQSIFLLLRLWGPIVSTPCSGRAEDADKVGLKVANYLAGTDPTVYTIAGKAHSGHLCRGLALIYYPVFTNGL